MFVGVKNFGQILYLLKVKVKAKLPAFSLQSYKSLGVSNISVHVKSSFKTAVKSATIQL